MAKSSEAQLQYAKAHHAANKEKHNKQAKAWKSAHPEQSIQLVRDWRKRNPNYNAKRLAGLVGPFRPSHGPDWKQRNRELFLKQKKSSNNRRRREIFVEALTHYASGTPRCYCCGESLLLLLGLDHIHGGGTKHREEIGNERMYVWAKRNGWPAIFRVACHSCNLGSHLNGGVCPHQEKADAQHTG